MTKQEAFNLAAGAVGIFAGVVIGKVISGAIGLPNQGGDHFLAGMLCGWVVWGDWREVKR